MGESEVEAAWRAEFERSGSTLNAANTSGDSTDELKKQAAFHWLRDEADTQRLQEETMLGGPCWSPSLL
jgi:hypothetical protein